MTITLFISIVALLISVFTWWKQERGSQIQNLYDMDKSLEPLMPTIEAVLKLEKVEYTEWSDDAQRNAHQIAMLLHRFGVFFMNNHADGKTFIRLWYFSLPKLIIIVRPYVEEKRTKNGEIYWSGIDVLEKLTDKHLKNFNGFAAN